jgi:hypothetical protein
MFAEQFPEVFGEQDNSLDPVDEQGQHTKKVRRCHYEHIHNVPPALNMSLSKARQFIPVTLGLLLVRIEIAGLYLGRKAIIPYRGALSNRYY